MADFFAYPVADDDATAAREPFCDVVPRSFESCVMAPCRCMTGAVDVEDTSSPKQHEPDPTRSRSFAAVGLVAQISAEPVSGAHLLFRSGNEYGVCPRPAAHRVRIPARRVLAELH